MLIRYSPTGLGPYGGDYPDERPRTRGECYGMPRPCPFASCRHHLLHDAHRTIDGTPRLRILHDDPTTMVNTCALDVADGFSYLPDPSEDQGIHNPSDGSVQTDLHEIGALCGIGTERVRQTLQRVQRILRAAMPETMAEYAISETEAEVRRKRPTDIDRARAAIYDELSKGPRTYQKLYDACAAKGISDNAVRWALQQNPTVESVPVSARQEAVEMLSELLARGPLEAKWCQNFIRGELGCSLRIVESAARDLGVVTKRNGWGKPCSWELPQWPHTPPASSATRKNHGTPVMLRLVGRRQATHHHRGQSDEAGGSR